MSRRSREALFLITVWLVAVIPMPVQASTTHDITMSVAETTRVAIQVLEGTSFAVELDYPSLQDYAHFQVEGSATLGGYMLARQETGVTHHYGIRLPESLTYADEYVLGRSECGINGENCELSPGLWWLYIIAEGGSATVTLTFNGAAPILAGAMEDVDTLYQPGVSEGPSAVLVGQEASHFSGSVSEASYFMGLGYAVFDEPLVFTESTYASAHGFCVYNGTPSAYVPGCPEGDAITVWPAAEWDHNRAYLGSILASSATGTRSGNMYHVTAGVQPSVLGSVGLWMSK